MPDSYGAKGDNSFLPTGWCSGTLGRSPGYRAIGEVRGRGLTLDRTGEDEVMFTFGARGVLLGTAVSCRGRIWCSGGPVAMKGGLSASFTDADRVRVAHFSGTLVGRRLPGAGSVSLIAIGSSDVWGISSRSARGLLALAVIDVHGLHVFRCRLHEVDIEALTEPGSRNRGHRHLR